MTLGSFGGVKVVRFQYDRCEKWACSVKMVASVELGSFGGGKRFIFETDRYEEWVCLVFLGRTVRLGGGGLSKSKSRARLAIGESGDRRGFGVAGPCD